MSTATNSLRLTDLSSGQVTAIRRKADRMGVTAEVYVKQLIADDLELDRIARSTPLHALAAPVRKALRGMSGRDIDRLVESARAARRRGSRPSSAPTRGR